MMFKDKKNIVVYTSYLGLVGTVGASIKWLGLNTQIGLGVILGIAAVYVIFWPRW